MAKTEIDFRYYVNLWNVRLHLSKYIEVVCPKCKECASPYFVASLNRMWELDEIKILADRLPFPTRIEKATGKNGYKLLSFPDESFPHPDIFLNNHSGEDEHTMPIVTQCSECHSRTVFGNRVCPKDLYWNVKTRHGVLWAYNREWLVIIRNVIEGDERPRGSSASRLSAEMLKASNRTEMVKLIDRVLLNGPQR